MKSVQIAAAVLFASSTMAMAQEKVQISYSGVLSIEHLSATDFDENFFYGNGDLSFRWASSTDLKFGADLGIETFGLLSNDTSYYDLTAYYASGVIEGQFGKFSVGMPRGIMDDYFSVPAMAGSEIFDLEIAILETDLFRYLKFTSTELDQNIYGVRYDGKIGKIKFAASISKFSEGSENVNIGEIVALYDAGQWSVTLGTSLLEIDGSSVNSTSLEVQGHAGKFSGGIVYNKSDALISFSDSARVFASYDVNDAVKINAQVSSYQFSGNSSELIYSLDLSYKHKSGAFVNAGVITSETLGALGDKTFNVSLGYKF